MEEDFSQVTIAIAGATGKMGLEATKTLQADPRFRVVAGLVRSSTMANASDLLQELPVYTDAEQLLLESKPDIWLDFTDAHSVVKNVNLALHYGVSPVIGATGYSTEDLERWQQTCREQRIGAIVAPNFAIGALLMIRFAQEAARFYGQAEILELHHDGKKDAPSGTARRTAEAVSAAWQEMDATEGASLLLSGQARVTNSQTLSPARGLKVGEVPIHSIRLPGLLAHQEVIFGGTGEILTLRHDSLSRTSFMAGVQFACRKVGDLSGLVYGLENLLW